MSPDDLYREHHPLADRIAWGSVRGGGHHLIDDIKQAAHSGLWVACLRWLPEKNRGNFETYAGQRIRWAIQDWWREFDHLPNSDRRAVKAGTRPPVTLVPGDRWHPQPDPAPDPADVAASRADAGVALWHLACLPNPMRDVFARHALNQETLADIAADYGKSDAWAYLLRRQAVERLRRSLRW